MSIWPFTRDPHQWSDWQVTERGGVFDAYVTTHRIGSYLIQERYCHVCGKAQTDKQSTTTRSGVHKPEEHTRKLRKDGVAAAFGPTPPNHRRRSE